MFIYCIENKLNGKKYIGQSTQKTLHRLQEHKSKLRSNSHENKHLQDSWNKYGEDKFSIEILKTCRSLSKLNALEEQYIGKFNTLDREFGYNIRAGGNNSFLSEETKRKISQTKQGVSVHTVESRRKISLAMTGRVHSLASRKKRSKKLKGIVWSDKVRDSWALGHRKGIPYPPVISPDGIVYHVTNMTQFCREHNLGQQCMSRLVTGNIKQYKGWRLA